MVLRRLSVTRVPLTAPHNPIHLYSNLVNLLLHDDQPENMNKYLTFESPPFSLLAQWQIMLIIQIWHPCRVNTRNNFPGRGLSLEGITRGWQSSRGEVICGEHPTGMPYLSYHTKQNAKHKRGKNYKQRFWINTRRLPCWTSFTGRSLGKLCRCSWVFFGLAVTIPRASGY